MDSSFSSLPQIEASNGRGAHNQVMQAILQAMRNAKLFRRLAGLLMACMAASGSASAWAQQAANGKMIVLAAGSLRDAINELGKSFERQTGIGVQASFGPSGKLREEIEAGRSADVFASASIEHTNALLARKLLSESVVFAHNDLCVVSRPEAGINADNLLDVIGKPTVRLATSTPVSDPMGDYTWQFFRNADKVQPGIFRLLDAKAMKLSGAAAPVPGAKLPYVTAFEDNRADAYVMYCTNAVAAKASVPDLTITRIPDALNVRNAYGIGANPASADGRKFVQFVLGPVGKEVLRKYGFH